MKRKKQPLTASRGMLYFEIGLTSGVRNLSGESISGSDFWLGMISAGPV
jgi:hypothetical protein